ncbi:MAG: metallophosphoesterase [Planctomycetes bacterium]|nr:metallophosphoesterase [Planctomycetota bacterium]
MPDCFFVSDLHGHPERYRKLFRLIDADHPSAVFLGGDLLPAGLSALEALDFDHQDFVTGFVVRHLKRLREALGPAYPRVFVILGNDDSRSEEAAIIAAATEGIWEYVHDRRVSFASYDVYGYACVPPTPFLMKDWERYDVSRYVDPGCVSPEDGHRSVPLAEHQIRYATIKDDLAGLVGARPLARAIMLFHAPPYQTKLDRAALDGKMVDHAPLDVHIGSVAIHRFIAQHQPLVTLHGHVHESARLTGTWQDRIGRTCCFSAAHDGPELALVRFDPAEPTQATRALI